LNETAESEQTSHKLILSADNGTHLAWPPGFNCCCCCFPSSPDPSAPSHRPTISAAVTQRDDRPL